MTSSDDGVRRRRSTPPTPTRWGRVLVVVAVLVSLAGIGTLGVFTGAETEAGPPVPPDGLLPPPEQLAAVRLGVTPACGPTSGCVDSLARVYGMDLSGDLAQYPDAESLLTALHRDTVLVAAVPATEPGLTAPDLVVLEDDLAMTASDRLVVVSRADPPAEEVLDAVTGALTADRLRDWISQARAGGDLADITASAATVLELPDDLPAGQPGSATTRLAVSGSELDQVVGAIYASALRARGHSVEVVDSDGAPGQGLLGALIAGEADVVVAAATDLLTALDGARAQPRAMELETTLAELRAALESADVPLVLLSATGPPVGMRHVVTEDIAERFELARLSDLIGAAPPVTPLDPG